MIRQVNQWKLHFPLLWVCVFEVRSALKAVIRVSEWKRRHRHPMAMFWITNVVTFIFISFRRWLKYCFMDSLSTVTRSNRKYPHDCPSIRKRIYYRQEVWGNEIINKDNHEIGKGVRRWGNLSLEVKSTSYLWGKVGNTCDTLIRYRYPYTAYKCTDKTLQPFA